ncbi:MAG TPA: rhomboid family intramembrane serine protease [Gemmatimonadaceae bacterium]|nr:rhomboid family intramembrane serine protease [Gemmatimonadaceae bacterium]
MFPLSDENPTVRAPVTTYLLIATIVGVWVLYQGAGLNIEALAASICDLGMVPGEITGRSPLGTAVPMGPNMACVVDDYAINIWTPITSMFLHGGWGHLLGNLLFFWVFGNNVEDSMGRVRFLVFYLLCGVIAAGSHVVLDPASPIPTVGASGAISGVLGAYLILYPHVRVRMLFWFLLFIRVFRVPAWAVLLWWFFWQVISGLPQLMTVNREVSGGVAVWAHIGGFVAGVILVKLFVNSDLHRRRLAMTDARDAFVSS